MIPIANDNNIFRPAALFVGLGASALLVMKYLKNLSHKSALQFDCICIELGGTSIQVAKLRKTMRHGKLVKSEVLIQKKGFETKDPEQSLTEITNYIKDYLGVYEELGVASFGPICLNKSDPDYGSITTTPKLRWVNFPLLKTLASKLNFTKEIAFDTDVNAAALAEFKLGNHKVSNSLIYITVGTGVGIGLVVEGKPVHGLMHPEGGHMLIPIHQNEQKDFKGVCAYHGNCLEGLVSNWSIAKRFNFQDVAQNILISDSDPVWDLIAYYLAVFCANLAYSISPEVIVLGGGVLNRKCLYQKIHQLLPNIFNGYLVLYKKTPEQFIKPPSLGENVGIIGASVI